MEWGGCGLFGVVYVRGPSASWGVCGLTAFADGRTVRYPQAPTSEDIRHGRTVNNHSDMMMDLHFHEHFVRRWCNTIDT